MQPNLQHNLSANVLNVNNFQNLNQITPSQLMNRRPSSSTAIANTGSNQFLNTNLAPTNQQTSAGLQINTQMSSLNSVSTSAINQPKSTQKDHLSSSANHLTTLDLMPNPMNNYAGGELMKTASVTLTTNTQSTNQFLDVNNNSNSYNNLRRKSSSALNNAPRFNRTLSLRSDLTNETEQNNLNNIKNTIEQQQIHQIQMPLNPQQQSSTQLIQQQQPQSSLQNPILIKNQNINMQNQQQLSNQLQQNQTTDYALIRQSSMRSSPILKATSDLDKQQQINYTSSSISSAIATPLRRPSSQAGTNQMQPRCISAMESLRNRRPLSISANSCSSSDELTDTESLSKAGKTTTQKHEVIANNNKIIGEIRLSIVMSKGLLEIEILEAKLDSTKIQSSNKPGKSSFCSIFFNLFCFLNFLNNFFFLFNFSF